MKRHSLTGITAVTKKDTTISSKSRDKRSGVLYSSVYNVGLAMLRLDHIQKRHVFISSGGAYNIYPYLPSYLPESGVE